MLCFVKVNKFKNSFQNLDLEWFCICIENWKNEYKNLWHQYLSRSVLADASICTFHINFLEKIALTFNSICYKQWWNQFKCWLIDRNAGISLFLENYNLLRKLQKYTVMWSCGINPFLILYLMMPASMLITETKQ